MDMSKLFETTHINGMGLPNRFVRSATWEGMAAEDGSCTPRLIKLMTQFAAGGVGLIITGHTYVRPDGQGSPWQLGIYKDELIEGLRDMTRAVHISGGRIAVQITHGGLFAREDLIGQTPLALSRVEDFGQSTGKEMTVDEIQSIIEAYVQAARRAKEAEFDAVQIHAAHGYLLSQSLSPAFNRRRDVYGGPVENRVKFLLKVLQGVRSVVGADFPILVKLNCQDFLDGGLILEDSLKVGTILEEEGIDAIELSGGTIVLGNHCRKDINSEENEAYFRNEAKAFKEKLHVPLILVGGIRSFQLAERLVEEGYTDYISMSRPFIREPDLVNRWASGDLRKATCFSDSLCRGPVMEGKGLYCVVEKKEKNIR